MDHSTSKKLAAWLVHIFTASGIFLGFLALLSSINNDFTLAILFLALALFVDGIDGTLARWLDVERVTPNIDGSILDIIIDYFNYVLVPTFMIHWFGFVGENYSIPICFIILLVSCYTFANKQIKTEDYYFSGFPALWNLVVLYFYILETSELTNILAVLTLSVFTFIPTKYVHPLRVVSLRKTNIIMTCFWCVTTVYLLLKESVITTRLESSIGDLVSIDAFVFYAWILINLYFFYITLRRSFWS